ncbi:MAG: PKD domain-containing protein [Chitinophagaceae bacterium]|nr:PKD domain-containing protein [Chitinophagaceae bacterium]
MKLQAVISCKQKTESCKNKPGFFASDSVACKDRDVRFAATIPSSNASRFIWDFGDGTAENTRENFIFHQYDHPGIYTIAGIQ